MTSTDPYSILGVARSATAVEIKAAYRLLAHERHPDKKSGSHEAFVQLTAAYEYALARCGRPAGSSASTSPPPRQESFDEFMARTYRHWERSSQEREEYFRRTHAHGKRCFDRTFSGARDGAIFGALRSSDTCRF